MKNLFLLVAMMLTTGMSAATYYISPTGDDNAAGTIEAPWATLARAQTLVQAGDTVFIRGGVYKPVNDQIMGRRDRLYNCVFILDKSGTEEAPICYFGYPGERPIFDLSEMYPDEGRISVMYVSGDWLHLRNFEIVNTRILPNEGNWQSECISNRGGCHNIYENLAMHDGMGIGFYLLRGSDNLVLNCDAYNNYENVTGNGAGGNVDGFGMHPQPGSTGNVMRGCRAWWNADDGFDLINASEAVLIDSCIAMYNGYVPGTLISAGDGNGFKAGGYGMKAKTKAPAVIPQHRVCNSIAYHNKVSGVYSNHHLGGVCFENNTSVKNQHNYNMVNRKSRDEVVDVPGYGHILTGNVSYLPRQNDIIHLNVEACTVHGNTFDADGETPGCDSFVSTDPSQLLTPRRPDGTLPRIEFLVFSR